MVRVYLTPSLYARFFPLAEQVMVSTKHTGKIVTRGPNGRIELKEVSSTLLEIVGVS
jgi:hypothetical protein